MDRDMRLNGTGERIGSDLNTGGGRGVGTERESDLEKLYDKYPRHTSDTS